MTATTKGWFFTTGPYGREPELGSIPIKADPEPHELIVRVKAAAINPVDVQIMNLPFWSYVPSFLAPGIKGTAKDFAGVVEKAGSETGWKKGDEIFGLYMGITVGTMQELAVIDTKASAIAPKPSAWSWVQAAALPLVYLTARTAIDSVAPYVTSTKKVVVLGGSSATGMYMVHLAKARGWHVVSTCSSRNTTFVQSMGADEVIDYTNPSAPTGGSAVPTGSTLSERVAAYAPEAILDCVGGTECVGLAKRYVTIVGDKTGRLSLGGSMIYATHPRMVLRHLAGYLGLVNSYACVNLVPTDEWLGETLRLPAEKIVIDSTFKFGQAREAFERLNTGRARGKVVVEVQ